MTDAQDAHNCRWVFANHDLQKYLVRCSSFIKKHPALSVVAGVVTSFYTVPTAIYIAFSIAAFVLTFIGFLVILGGVLLVGFLVLASVLATITVIVLFVSCISWILYTTYRQLNLIPDAEASVVVSSTQPDHHQYKEEPSR